MEIAELEELGRHIALYQERLRMPTLTKADAMALAGRESESAWYRFISRHGLRTLPGGRIRRRDLEAALKKESLGQ